MTTSTSTFTATRKMLAAQGIDAILAANPGTDVRQAMSFDKAHIYTTGTCSRCGEASAVAYRERRAYSIGAFVALCAAHDAQRTANRAAAIASKRRSALRKAVAARKVNVAARKALAA